MAQVAELFSEQEWHRFFSACDQAARQAGGLFLLDESVHLAGEREWARYIRTLMVSVGLEDLAARINVDEFPAGSVPLGQAHRAEAPGATPS